jgi:CHAT domain/WD domain, G-beta repeat
MQALAWSVKPMAEDVPEYDELSLRIQQGRGDAYRVLVQGPGGETAEGEFSNPFSALEIENFVLQSGVPRRKARGFRSSAMTRAKEFGSRLHGALLQGEIRDVYLGARRVAEDRRRGLRVTLCLTGTPELMQIPWEFLYEPPQFLAQSMYTPVVRSLDLHAIRKPREVRLPLRILGMVSTPAGFASLDVDEEKEKLEESLGALIEAGIVQVNWLPSATLAALDRAISEPDEEHVLHYIGHGAYDERTQDGVLVLEDRRGEAHEVSGEELSSLLQDERSLRLVVLNACEGARSSHVDPFSGVASSIVGGGIPAVIGMQFEITDEAAIAFSERLYRALAHGYPVDAALAQARRAIYAAGADIEFGTPVLFLRSGDARLFHPEDVPSAVPEPETEPRPAEAEPTQAEDALEETVSMDALISAFREELETPPEDTTDWGGGATAVMAVQHDGRVAGVAISPDSSLLASASADSTARLWTMLDGELATRLDHAGPVAAVAFSPVERMLATAANDLDTWLWEVDTGNRVFYPGSERRAFSHDVAISPDGRRLAYGWPDKRAVVFEVETGALVADLRHKGAVLGNVQAVEFSPEGLWLVTASSKAGRVWDLDDGDLVTMVRHAGMFMQVSDTAFSPGGHSFATTALDGVARIWSFPGGGLQKELKHPKPLQAIDFSPGGAYVATACDDSSARIWDVRSGALVTELAHAEPVVDVAFSADGAQLATASGYAAYVWAADG